MSFYGYNRSAFNGSVSGIIAGAALVVASGSFAATGTRQVVPETINVSVNTGATGLGIRNVLGGAGFVTTTVVTVWPALLQLQAANIVITSALTASYSDAWGYISGSLEGTGFITRPGQASSFGTLSVTAASYVEAGFSSVISVKSAFQADPSIQLSGQTTWQREGYAVGNTSSSATVNSLRTALGYSEISVVSTAATDSLKTHGGSARFDSVWATGVVASTDAAFLVAKSVLYATGLLTQAGEVAYTCSSAITVEPTKTTYGEVTALTGTSLMTSEGRLGVLASSNLFSGSTAQAVGTIYKMGAAEFTGFLTTTAIGGYLLQGNASSNTYLTVTVTSFTNAEAPDPAARVMVRPFTDRAMSRIFIDRTMRRTA